MKKLIFPFSPEQSWNDSIPLKVKCGNAEEILRREIKERKMIISFIL